MKWLSSLDDFITVVMVFAAVTEAKVYLTGLYRNLARIGDEAAAIRKMFEREIDRRAGIRS
jgi:hypothetical protein